MNEDQLQQVTKKIEEGERRWVERLKEFVAIKSVSGDSKYRGDVKSMIEHAKKLVESFGGVTELHDIGEQTMHDGSKLPLPPVLFARIPAVPDPTKKTVGIYGHLDVQPALKSDGWNSEPFLLTEKDGKLFGRGSTDDKGPVAGWFNCIESFRDAGVALPINLKFIFEGMEESGSVGLEPLLKKQKDFFNDMDFMCISDNYWLGTKKPSITYGLRGLVYYFVEISCASRDLHSGSHGGSVHEAMSDLVALLDTLVDLNGKILIPGVYDSVAPLLRDEEQLYEAIEFDMNEHAANFGLHKPIHQDSKEKHMQHIWRYPSLSIHGIEGAFSEPGAKTVIPAKVIGKFSIRLVPDQKPDVINALVTQHLEAQMAKRGSPNKMTVHTEKSGPAWYCKPSHPNFQCGIKATQRVYGVMPEMTREGGSIPITLTFEELLGPGKSVMLLPMGQSDDGAHSQNEKLSLRNYVLGTKMFAAYMYEVSQLK
jgi:nonspecific dipeptidase